MALKLGTSKGDVFKCFQVTTKVAEKKVRQAHSVQALLHDDCPGYPPGQVNVHRIGGNPFGKLSVGEEIIIRDSAVYAYEISFLGPVSSDMVASVFQGDPRDSASKRLLRDKNVYLFIRRDATVSRTPN